MKGHPRTIAIAVIGALLLISAACGRHHDKVPGQGAVPLEPKAYALQDALTELDTLEKPGGVDEKVWRELKGALKEALLVEGRGFIPRRNSPESRRRGVKHPPFSPDSGIQNPESRAGLVSPAYSENSFFASLLPREQGKRPNSHTGDERGFHAVMALSQPRRLQPERRRGCF